jgi:hypothetical protein
MWDRQRLNSRSKRRTRLGVLAVVLIVVAAIVAPVAMADKWGAARTSTNGAATLRPDDRNGVRGNILVSQSRDSGATLRPDDRSGARGNTLLSEPVVISASNEASGPIAFQWGDAGIGGVIAVAAMMLGGAIVFVVRRPSTRPSAI